MNRALPVHQSLHRHAHVLGAEREPVMTAALIALLVGVGGLTIVSAISAAAFWLIAVFALRHVKQQDFYPAKASCWRLTGGFTC